MKINFKSDYGFTLIELLVSVIVLVAVGLVITGVISSSLRSTNKTNNIENIRQNGNYALSQMLKDIAYAQTFNRQTTGLSNDYTAIPPYPSSCSPSPGTTYKYIAVQSASNIVVRYMCSGSELSSEGISPVKAKASLIDQTSISLSGCSIICTQASATDVPIIEISFTLGPKNPNGLVESSNPPIKFETSVTMRNYR